MQGNAALVEHEERSIPHYALLMPALVAILALGGGCSVVLSKTPIVREWCGEPARAAKISEPERGV